MLGLGAMVQTQSGLAQEQWPSEQCGIVIVARKAFCWVPAAGWEMEQEQICNLCQKKSRIWRIASWRRCSTCASRVSVIRWMQGFRQCYECCQRKIRN